MTSDSPTSDPWISKACREPCTCCAPSSYEPGHLASRSHGALVGEGQSSRTGRARLLYRAAIERFGEPALDLACAPAACWCRCSWPASMSTGPTLTRHACASPEARHCAEDHPTLTPQAIRELDLPGHYRTIFICDSFGIGGSRADDLEGLRRIYPHLEPGGALLFSHHLPYGDEESEWLRWLPHRHGEAASWPETGDRRRAADGDGARAPLPRAVVGPVATAVDPRGTSTAVARGPPRARGRARHRPLGLLPPRDRDDAGHRRLRRRRDPERIFG